jgi:hypothetical protein
MVPRQKHPCAAERFQRDLEAPQSLIGHYNIIEAVTSDEHVIHATITSEVAIRFSVSRRWERNSPAMWGGNWPKPFPIYRSAV